MIIIYFNIKIVILKNIKIDVLIVKNNIFNKVYHIIYYLIFLMTKNE